ncbi:MAG: hypothetical protein HON23_07225 [Rickettsiales bacterium]|jgi:hypothetical protein|nr:hypothetical protein [Rickettsiales bacterium]
MDLKDKIMALNTIIWRFDGYDDSLQEILALEAKEIINVKQHFVLQDTFRKLFKDAEYVSCHLHHRPLEELKVESVDYKLLQKMRKDLINFLTVSDRSFSDQYSFDSMILSKVNMHAEMHFYSIVISYFANLIRKKEIELVLFDEVPHYPGSYALYLVAKAMNIKTIIFSQTMFNDKTFCVHNIEDIGDLINKNPDLSEISAKQINKTFKKELYYMGERRDDKFKDYLNLLSCNVVNMRTFKIIFNRFKTFLLSKSRVSNNRSGVDKVRFANDVSLIKDMLRIFQGMRYKKDFYKRAYTAYQALAQKAYDKDVNFVYFSLHYQPEATTVPMGGEYMDQAKALEDLASILPDDYYIYVKEHPNSFGGLRSENFYLRLSNIPNLVLLDSSVSNYDLLANAKIIATITGTVGFEAISGGKPVITFGYSWYNNLPGVYRFCATLDISEVINCKIDHNELEEEFAKVSAKLGDFAPFWGLFKEHYPKDIDRKQNTKKFVAAIEKMLI